MTVTLDYIAFIAFWVFMFLFAWSQYRGHNFNVRSFAALFLGVLFGCCLKWLVPKHCMGSFVCLEGSLSFVANAYIGLLKMLIVPLVLTSIINAVANLRQHQGSYLAAISFKSVGML